MRIKNIVLSQSRAGAVKNYLVDKGITATHLSTEGQGSNQPVADNTTPQGRKKIDVLNLRCFD